jgi:hypothetical protein
MTPKKLTQLPAALTREGAIFYGVDSTGKSCKFASALFDKSEEPPLSLQEVVEWPTYADRPAVGAANTIYIDLSTDDMYYWNGSDYAPLNSSSTTITIRSLSDLDDKTTVGVYTVLWIQNISGRKSVVSYTLRVESSVGIVSQYLENKKGYSWRKRQTSTGVWYDWINVTFATTAYVDEAIGDINTVLDLIITGE